MEEPPVAEEEVTKVIQANRFFAVPRFDEEAKVVALEYDPNRARLILLCWSILTERKSYILAPTNLKVGDNVVSSNEPKIEFKSGQCNAFESDSAWHESSLC